MFQPLATCFRRQNELINLAITQVVEFPPAVGVGALADHSIPCFIFATQVDCPRLRDSSVTQCREFRRCCLSWHRGFDRRTLASVQNEMCELTKALVRIAHISFLRLKTIPRIDHVLLMIDGEYSPPVDLDVDVRLVTARKPKTINSLISPDKISSIDPEGWFLSRVTCDFHNREVLGVDPYFPLKQILIFAFRNGL